MEQKYYDLLNQTINTIEKNTNNDRTEYKYDAQKQINTDNSLIKPINLFIHNDSEKKIFKVQHLNTDNNVNNSSEEINLNELKLNFDKLINNSKLFLHRQSSQASNTDTRADSAKEIVSDELRNLKLSDINLLKSMNYLNKMKQKYEKLKVEINVGKFSVLYRGYNRDIVNAQKDAESLLNETKYIIYEFDKQKLKFLELNIEYINEYLQKQNINSIISTHYDLGNLIIYSSKLECIEKCYDLINDQITVKKFSIDQERKSSASTLNNVKLKLNNYLKHLIKISINNNEFIETILFRNYLIKQLNSNEFYICGFKNETRKAYFEVQKCDTVDLECLDI